MSDECLSKLMVHSSSIASLGQQKEELQDSSPKTDYPGVHPEGEANTQKYNKSYKFSAKT